MYCILLCRIYVRVLFFCNISPFLLLLCLSLCYELVTRSTDWLDCFYDLQFWTHGLEQDGRTGRHEVSEMQWLTADDALAVDGDGYGVAVHVWHVTQDLAAIVQVPHANVFIAACRQQLRTVATHAHTHVITLITATTVAIALCIRRFHSERRGLDGLSPLLWLRYLATEWALPAQNGANPALHIAYTPESLL